MTEQNAEQALGEIPPRFNVELGDEETLLRIYTRYGIVFVRHVSGLILALAVAAALLWWLTRPGSLVPQGLVIGLGLIALAVILAILAYVYVDWRNDALIMTDQRLIYVEQVIMVSQAQREAALRNVQDVRFATAGLLARILDYGKIEIETAARGSDITFGPVRHPQATQKEIMDRVRALRTAASAQLMKQTLLHRLDPQRYPAPEVIAPAPAGRRSREVRSRSILPFLPPNPRIEADTIIWHKHGLFLIARLLRAILIMVLLAAVAFLLRYLGVPPLAWLIWGAVDFFALFYLVWNYQIWLGDVYLLTVDSIHDIYRTPWGLFGESRRSAGLERIQNISLRKPGLLANLLDYGNVRIQTAGAEDFGFDRIPRPEEVQREIYRRQELFRQRQQQRERDQIADWLLTFRKISVAPPTIVSLDPASVEVGRPGLTVTVNGSNLLEGMTVQWNGADRKTTFVSSRQLKVSLSAADLHKAGAFNVTVVDPTSSDASNQLLFAVVNPRPTIYSLVPDSAQAGGPGFAMTVAGNDLVANAVVQWNAVDRWTTPIHTRSPVRSLGGGISDVQLIANILADDIGAPGIVMVTVVNPGPGGGISNALPFVLTNPGPDIGSLQPAGVPAGGPGFTLHISGRNLLQGSVVQWNGANRPTTFINGMQLTAAILASDIATPGSAVVTVVNPEPGGGVSEPKAFTIEPA